MEELVYYLVFAAAAQDGQSPIAQNVNFVLL